jgi:SAM-dependent methyltransferase
MNDPLSAHYDALPYRHGALPKTAPARLGVIGRFHGVAAAGPERARVLELGCGEGMNLLPIAERFPAAECVGVDFSPRQIAVAEAARAACGISNAQFICADLREYEPAAEQFDYIIAHGVYSWVPDEVKERLLAICARACAPHGLVYLSYNTQPGFAPVAGLREVLRAHLAHLTEPGARAAEVERLLPVLEAAFASEQTPYATLMREVLAEMRSKPVALVMHDELETVNDPRTFTEFNAHAGRHGLHFLAEAHYAAQPYEHLNAKAREALAPLATNFLAQQQWLDLLAHRRFRASIYTRVAAPAREPDFTVVNDCALTLRLRLEHERVDLRRGAPIHLVGQHGVKFAIDQPFQKAFFAAVLAAAPRRITFPEAIETARRYLAKFAITAEETVEALCIGLGKFFALDQVDLLLAGGGGWLRDRNPVAPSALMRHQAANALPIVNRWHETITLTAQEKRWLAGAAVTVDTERMKNAGVLL